MELDKINLFDYPHNEEAMRRFKFIVDVVTAMLFNIKLLNNAVAF